MAKKDDKKRLPTLLFHSDWYELLEEVGPEEGWDIIMAILRYAYKGETPKSKKLRQTTFLALASIKRDREAYEELCEKRREAGRKRWELARQKDEQDAGSAPAPKKKSAQSPKTASPASAPNARQTKGETNAVRPAEVPARGSRQDPDEAEFEAVRKLYPGTKDGAERELQNLKKKYPGTWRDIVPKLRPGVERYMAYIEEQQAHRRPDDPVRVCAFSVYINQGRWDREYEQLQLPRRGAAPMPTRQAPPDKAEARARLMGDALAAAMDAAADADRQIRKLDTHDGDNQQ